jgi:hypothetical protein
MKKLPITTIGYLPGVTMIELRWLQANGLIPPEITREVIGYLMQEVPEPDQVSFLRMLFLEPVVNEWSDDWDEDDFNGYQSR